MGTKLKPSEHDVWDRTEPDEPRIAFAARDILVPPLIRAYAAAIAGDVNRVMHCYVALIRKMADRPYRPEKDAQHVISARETANQMELWYINKQKPALNERQIAHQLEEFTGGPSVYGDVSIANLTGFHSEAADRWAVIETPENPHLQRRETVFVGPGAEERARDWARSLQVGERLVTD